MSVRPVQYVELLLGSIGVILGVFFATFLLFNYRKQNRANLFLAIYLCAFSLRVGKSLFHNSFEIDATLRTFFLSTLLCVGPSIWLYTRYLLDPGTKPRTPTLIHYVVFFILAGSCWAIPNDGSWVFGIFYNILIIHMFGYIVYSLFWLKQQKDINSLHEGHKIKRWLYYFLGLNLLLVVMYFLISELIVTLYIGISFLFSTVIILLSFRAMKNPFLFRSALKKYKNSILDSSDSVRLMKKLKLMMEEEKPYLDPTLNLSQLSSKLGVSTKVLSQAINQVTTLNYSQYIAQYRVEEVKRLMIMAPYTKMTIAAIAYDCGFNSISTFNTAFKTFVGVTATEYRKSL